MIDMRFLETASLLFEPATSLQMALHHKGPAKPWLSAVSKPVIHLTVSSQFSYVQI